MASIGGVSLSDWLTDWVCPTFCGIFNERAARRSRSTSRFGCPDVWMSVTVSLEQLEQLRNNFKVQLRWLPLTESTQIFLCDSVCVSSTWVRGPRGPRGPRGVRGVRKKIIKQKLKNFFKKIKKNLAALFRKVDSSPALVVGPPWRHFFYKMS